MPKFIPGTKSIPDTKDGWQLLYSMVSNMSQESCERVLDANGWAHNAMVLLDYRKEMCALCRSKGASPSIW